MSAWLPTVAWLWVNFQETPTSCGIWKSFLSVYAIPTCYYRNKGEVEIISLIPTHSNISISCLLYYFAFIPLVLHATNTGVRGLETRLEISILLVNCYLAVLWPELWLQCQSGHCLWGYSGLWSHNTRIWASRENDASLETISFKALNSHQTLTHKHLSMAGSLSVVTIATQLADHIWNKETPHVLISFAF